MSEKKGSNAKRGKRGAKEPMKKGWAGSEGVSVEGKKREQVKDIMVKIAVPVPEHCAANKAVRHRLVVRVMCDNQGKCQENDMWRMKAEKLRQ